MLFPTVHSIYSWELVSNHGLISLHVAPLGKHKVKLTLVHKPEAKPVILDISNLGFADMENIAGMLHAHSEGNLPADITFVSKYLVTGFDTMLCAVSAFRK